jgi:hypothetical protein
MFTDKSAIRARSQSRDKDVKTEKYLTLRQKRVGAAKRPPVTVEPVR